MVTPIAFFILILILWETGYRREWWNGYLFPGPSQVVQALIAGFKDHSLIIATRISLVRLIVAFSIAMVLGTLLGILNGTVPMVRRAIGPLALGLQTLPSICWLPLAIIWFGFTDTTKLTVVVYTLVVPVMFNTVVGVRAIPENYVLALQSLGASRLRIAWDVYLPGALPSIVVGLRLGMGYGWRALIAAEMLVRRGGLGDLIFGARTFSQIDRIMVGMIVIGTLYVIVDRLLVQPVENLTLARWGVLRS